MSERLYFEDVEVGQKLPPFVRETHFEEWNRYAAVNDEFVPIHMDDEAGRASGNEGGAFGMGNLRLSYLRNMLTAWIGDEAEVREIGLQYRGLNQKHDVLTCVGEVTEKSVEDGENRVRVDINVVNQEGKATAPGHAIVVLPSRAG
jgi:acyl dehydratase